MEIKSTTNLELMMIIIMFMNDYNDDIHSFKRQHLLMNKRGEEEEKKTSTMLFILFCLAVLFDKNKTNKVMKMIDLCTEKKKPKSI